MDPAVNGHLEGDLPFVAARLDKEQMGHLHAAQRGIQTPQWLFQIFGADQGQLHLHRDAHRLLPTIVEHRHPLQVVIGSVVEAEAVGKSQVGGKGIRVDALHLEVLALIDSLVAKEGMA